MRCSWPARHSQAGEEIDVPETYLATAVTRLTSTGTARRGASRTIAHPMRRRVSSREV